MDEFYCDAAKLATMKTNMENLKNNLSEALQHAKTLQSHIEDGTWSGKQKDTMVAFMDLMVQYHSDLAQNARNPVDAMAKTLEEFSKKLDTFYEDFEEYKEMEGIQ